MKKSKPPVRFTRRAERDIDRCRLFLWRERGTNAGTPHSRAHSGSSSDCQQSQAVCGGVRSPDQRSRVSTEKRRSVRHHLCVCRTDRGEPSRTRERACDSSRRGGRRLLPGRRVQTVWRSASFPSPSCRRTAHPISPPSKSMVRDWAHRLAGTPAPAKAAAAPYPRVLRGSFP